MMTLPLPQDGVEQQEEKMMMEMIVALTVMTIAADRQSTVNEVYVNYRGQEDQETDSSW